MLYGAAGDQECVPVNDMAKLVRDGDGRPVGIPDYLSVQAAVGADGGEGDRSSA